MIENNLPKKLESILGNESKSPSRVFIDLGSGTFNAAFSGNRDFKGNDYYVGVDRRREELEKAFSPDLHESIVKNEENFQRVGENVFLLERSVHDLPFPDASVDEVLLGNILGDRAIHDANDFLVQAKRILKTDGVLVVLETVTPVAAEDRDQNGNVNNFIENFGFKKNKELKFGDPGFQEEVSKYAMHYISHLDDTAFIVYFTKEVDKK